MYYYKFKINDNYIVCSHHSRMTQIEAYNSIVQAELSFEVNKKFAMALSARINAALKEWGEYKGRKQGLIPPIPKQLTNDWIVKLIKFNNDYPLLNLEELIVKQAGFNVVKYTAEVSVS